MVGAGEARRIHVSRVSPNEMNNLWESRFRRFKKISRPVAYLFRVVVSDWCRAHVTTEVAILQFQKLQFLGAHVLHVADEAHHLVGVEQSRVLRGDRFLQRNPDK